MNLSTTKGAYKYVFEKRYEHFLLFRLEDEDGKLLYRECFKNVAEAQSNMKAGQKVDWGELITEVDLNAVKTEENRQKLEKALGFEANPE